MNKPLDAFVLVSQALLCLASLLTLIRMWRGPSLMNRLMAMDFLSIVVIGLILLEGHSDRSRAMMTPAVVLALVSFVATIAFARLLEGHSKGGGDS